MLTVSRGKRFIALLINLFTFWGLFVGGIYLLIAKRTTLGGMLMGFKFEGGNLFVYWLTMVVVGLGYSLTLNILWLVDVFTMDKRDATFSEKLAGIKKVNA